MHSDRAWYVIIDRIFPQFVHMFVLSFENQTKVTLESFLAWKKRKIQEKKDLLAQEEEQKKRDYKSGRQFGISGREMFSFNPDLATDNDLEDGDAAYASYEREDDDENVFEYKDLDLDMLAADAQEVYIQAIQQLNKRFEPIFFFIKWNRLMERAPLQLKIV